MALFAVLMAAGVIVVAYISPLQLYQPKKSDGSERMFGMFPGMEILTIPSRAGELTGYLMKNASDARPLVLYFGGSAETAAGAMRSTAFDASMRRVLSGCHFAAVDYPGYGASDGTPSAYSIKRMALDVYDALLAREDVSSVIVMGFSLGTGPACYVASRRDVAGLVLLAPYADGVDLFNNTLDIFYGPLRLLVDANFFMPNTQYASRIRVHPLILTAGNDAYIPYHSSRKLVEAFPQGAEHVQVPGVSHNTLWTSETTKQAVEGYISRVAGQ